MSTVVDSPALRLWSNSRQLQLMVGMAIAALTVAFLPGLEQLVTTWNTVEEYSFGWFIGPLVAFLVWQRSERLRQSALPGSWTGVILLAFAVLMCIAGRLSLVRLFLQYGYVIGLCGVALSAIGWRGTRVIGVPLIMLFFTIPLPHFVLNQVSEQLQLISSQLGVGLIRACDISVFLEGNVIDLGSMRLQVVDACSGLRYLFPLMALGLVAAYFFHASFWKRATIVVSTVPLTVLINSLRIGLIGITVEYGGPAMAQGLLHDFEGWFMFMVCLVIMVGEMALLARIGSRGGRLRSSFGVDLPRPYPRESLVVSRDPSVPLCVATALACSLALATLAWPMRAETEPVRQPFALFPLQLGGGWIGRPATLDSDTVTTLQMDDYLLVDYFNGSGTTTNLYIAYYATQTGAEKASHSPRVCIPAGGWAIASDSQTSIALSPGRALSVNRAVIERGDQRALVYYWFKQGPRNVANDWLVKWYIVSDSINHGRTDGALIRLVAPIPSAVPIDAVDKQLADFVRISEPLIPAYVPD